MLFGKFLSVIGWPASLAAALFAAATGEDRESKPGEPWVVYYTVGTGAGLDAGPMQSKLDEKGYPVPEAPLRSVYNGGGGYGLRKGGPLLIGGEGGGHGNQYVGERYSTFPGGGEGFLFFGYVFNWLERLRVYPLLGVGGGGVGITVAETDSKHGPPRDKDKRVAWGEGSMLVNLGAGAEVTLGGKYGLVLGVRVGYIFNPLGMFGKTVNMSRPYVRFVLGGGRLE
ncbi:MAG: hypothetical protein JXB47_16800 [Anaerolineae bacterium]|nr:hypothetical protein [Anaerolineae bacterium]